MFTLFLIIMWTMVISFQHIDQNCLNAVQRYQLVHLVWQMLGGE
jgi:hypothetical protein